MTGHQLPIPGTEPPPAELARARHNLGRDHIRHRLTNLANRLTALASMTHGLTDHEADRLDHMLARLEDAMNWQADV